MYLCHSSKSTKNGKILFIAFFLIIYGIADPSRIGLQGHSWGGYQVAYLITRTDIFTCACSETAVANMTSAYTGLRAGAGKPRMFMYESIQSRIGGSLW